MVINKVTSSQFQHRWWVSFDPDILPVKIWSGVIVLALLFTATWTPWEVGYLPNFCFPHPLYCVNRFVDSLFVLDMLLQFFLIKLVDGPNGLHKVADPWRISTIYLRGWFVVDLISVLPFDSLGCNLEMFASESATSRLNDMKVIRTVRLLRFLKLLRLLRSSRVIATVETKFEKSRAVNEFVKFFLGTFIAAHLMACVWGFVGRSVNRNVFMTGGCPYVF